MQSNSINSAYLKIFVLSLFIALTPSSASASTSQILDWSVKNMTSWIPPGTSNVSGAVESVNDGVIRYNSIASDAISVAYDSREQPLFTGQYARAKTLAVMLSIAGFESGYRKDVDSGVGRFSKGDGGRSWCLMQVQLSRLDPSTGKTRRRIALKDDLYEFVSVGGFGGEDLVSDRKACFRVALHIIRKSFRACYSNPIEEKLAVYASGKCYRGIPESRSRMNRAILWWNKIQPDISDSTQTLEPSENPIAVLHSGL